MSDDDDAQLLERAIGLACLAHQGQRYPSPEPEPYILHPLRVMLAVDGMQAQTAAVLHDILEDTPTDLDQLRAAGIPPTVLEAVLALTHRAGQTYEQYIEQVAANDIARQVKLADLAENLANNRRLPPAPTVLARIERYQNALRRLIEATRHPDQQGRRSHPAQLGTGYQRQMPNAHASRRPAARGLVSQGRWAGRSATATTRPAGGGPPQR